MIHARESFWHTLTRSRETTSLSKCSPARWWCTMHRLPDEIERGSSTHHVAIVESTLSVGRRWILGQEDRNLRSAIAVRDHKNDPTPRDACIVAGTTLNCLLYPFRLLYLTRWNYPLTRSELSACRGDSLSLSLCLPVSVSLSAASVFGLPHPAGPCEPSGFRVEVFGS